MSDISLAIELLEQGHREDAVRELEKILAEDIDQISAWRLLATAVTNPIEIKECYEHVLRLNPHDEEAIAMLRSLTGGEVSGDVMPFVEENLPDPEYNWETLDEPPVQPGIDTAPLQLAPTDLAPVPQVETLDEAQPAQSSEARLFDEEGPSPVAKHEGGGFFENDAIFYTLIIVMVIAVLAIIYFLFRDSLTPLLNSILPN